MENPIKIDLWSQFGASIEMFENAIKMCPDDLWDSEKKFWYNAFHCIFFMDYYLSTNPKEFTPPAPFDFSEFEERMPGRVYTQEELLNYLQFCKNKGKSLFEKMDYSLLKARWVNESGTMNFSIFEILIYNMRHIQHHTAQLNMSLRQNHDIATEWVFRSLF